MAPSNGQRYVQRVNGFFIETISIDNFQGSTAATQIVALNASGYVDPSLIYSIAGAVVTGINGATGNVTISGGVGISVTTSGNVILISASGDVKPIGVNIDGGGSTPSTGLKFIIPIAFNGNIIGWTAFAEDVIGSCTVDIWFSSGSAPPAAPTIPTSGNLISASAPVTISGARSAAGGANEVSTWTTTLTKWGSVGFNLTSISGMTRLLVQILVSKTS